MGRGVGHLAGGIVGLYRFLTEHGEAVEFELLYLPGRPRLEDLGTRRLTWRDLLVLVKHAPSTSAIARAVHGEIAAWDANAFLLATVIDVLQLANWQRSGKKRGPKPKPVKRPNKAQRIGASKAMDLDDLDKRLGYSPRT